MWCHWHRPAFRLGACARSDQPCPCDNTYFEEGNQKLRPLPDPWPEAHTVRLQYQTEPNVLKTFETRTQAPLKQNSSTNQAGRRVDLVSL